MSGLDLENIDLGGFGISEDDEIQPELNTQVRANMDEALKINPDQHANITKLSKESDIPEFAVESDPAQVEHELKLDNIDFNQMSKRNPNTAKYLTDFNNSVIAQDDIDVLQSIEDTLSSVTQNQIEFTQQAIDVSRAFPAGAISGFGMAFEGAGRTLQAGANLAARGLDVLLPESLDPYLYLDEKPSKLEQIAMRLSPATLLRLEGAGLKEAGEIIGVPEERRTLATDISGALGQMTQQIATHLLNPIASGVALFAQGVDQQGERQEATNTEGQSLESDLALLTGGMITAVSEKVGLDKLLDRLPPKIKNDILRNIIDIVMAGGIESIQEIVENIGQGVLEKYTTNPDAEIFKGLEHEAIVAGGAGAIARAVIVMATPGRSRSVQEQEEAKQSKGEIEQQNIDTLNEKSENSKLRERDKESFKQFVNEADGENNTNVFIDGAQTSLYLQSKTPEEIEADPALKLLAEQAREASQLGTDVQIPVADFATEIAGTDTYTELRDSMTMSEETTSPFRQEQVDKETETYIKTLMDEAQENTSEYVEAQEIYTQVRDQLIDTGAVTPANASIMAQIVPAWATAQARRQGKTVQQVYQDSGLIIEGPATGERARLEGELILEQAQVESDALNDLFNQYDDTGEITHLDLVDEIEAFIEDSEGDFTDLSKAVSTYRQEQREDQELGGRGDMDTAESNFNDVLLADVEQRATLLEQRGVIEDGKILEREDGDRGRRPITENQALIEEAKTRTDEQALSEFQRAERGEEITVVHRAHDPEGKLNDQKLDEIDPKKTPSAYFGHYTGAQDVGNAARHGNDVTVHKIQLKKPLTISAETFEAVTEGMTAEEAIAKREFFKSEGHDGLMVQGLNWVVAFESDSFTEIQEDFGDVEAMFAQEAPTDLLEGNLDESGKYTETPGDVQPTDEVRDRAIITGRETIKQVEVGFETLDTPAKVALATIALSKSPQEKFWAITLDKDNKPLAILNHTMGVKDAASVDPAAVAGWAVSVEGATQVYFSHNHPSDISVLSSADKTISAKIKNLLDGSGVESKGIMAVTPVDFTHEDGTSDFIPIAETSNKVDLVERTLERLSTKNRKAITSPATAKSIIEDLSQGDEGVLLLNGQHVPVGFLPFDFEKHGGQLRGGKLATLLKAVESTNAAAVMLNTKKLDVNERNVANMLAAADMRVLDAFVNGESATERGLDISTGTTFKQEARGYYDPANSVIRLTEAADLSTFLHEFAHFMYEMEVNGNTEMLQSINSWYKRNAEDVAKEAMTYVDGEFDVLKQGERTDKTPVEITPEDVITFLDDGTTDNKDKDSAIRRAVHEQFARGFETYLMEGKAPSIELRNAFRAFARWLSRIYQAMKGQLGVKLDPEMRQVFDRLLATEEQIAAAEARARVEPMFTDAAMAGMTEEEFADYQTRQEKVKDVQSETLRDKIIKQLTRQRKKGWKEEKQDIIDEEIESLNKQQVYEARNQLKDGDIKLDHATVKEMVGEEKTNKLGRKSVVIPPELRGMTAKGQEGIHPDEAAAFLGYKSGSEMLHDLTTAPKIKVQAEVNAEVRMIDRHGDILTDGTIEREADEAVRNEERGKLILAELKALAKGTNAPTIDRQTIKDLAKTNIGKLSFREIHPGKYRKAEIRAAQEAATMLAAGNKEGAATAKMRQVMNYYLGMAATDAKNETTKIVDRMARYNKKKVREEIMKAEGGYWDQIVKILERFEFRKSVTLKEIESLNVWMKERMESDGDGLVLSNAVLNESFVTHWKNIPFSDLQGVNDSVKNIEHVARYSNKMTTMQEEIDFRTLKANWIDSIGKQDARFKTKESRSRIDDARKSTAQEHIQRWISQLTKVPFLASWLDGGDRVGISHDILVQPFTNALDVKMKMVDDVATPVIKAIAGRSKEDQKRHMTNIYIPEIDDTLLGHQILAVALNTGNQGNLKKLLLGEGWANPENDAEITFDNPKLQAVLAHMTKSDWELVQLIWDQMETLYPQLSEVHRRTTGLVPPKVEATPIETKHGTFKGGYYPVKYSPKRSHKAEKNAEKREAETESMFNNTASIQSSVNAGATNERTGFYDRIYLSLEVVPDHFNETIHYITHHDAVRQINRLIQSPDVASAITAVMGEAEFKELKPWLNDIAKDGRQQPVKTYIDEAFQQLRFGTTLGVMGFKATTGIMQLFGLLTSAAELGAGPTIKGVQTTIGRSWYMRAARKLLGNRDDLQSGWEFASERSKVLNHRTKTMDREIRNAMNRLSQKTGALAAIQETSMKHIALIQTYMVDLPTWHAAYDKHLSNNGDEAKAVQFADATIENIQGSGATKDMARIMRNQSKIHSTFTMFMTYFSSLGNLTRDLARGAKSGDYSLTSTAAKVMFLFTLPVFFEMLMRGELDEPDDEDERMSKFLTGVALYPLTSIPFVRDVASGALSDFGYNSTPVASLMERGIESGKGLVKNILTDEEITKSQIKNVSKLAGATLGIPGINQVWATGEHLYDVIEEGEELTTRELLFGPKR